jgi:hypothetical protein
MLSVLSSLLLFKCIFANGNEWIVQNPPSFKVETIMTAVHDHELVQFDMVLKQSYKFIYKIGDGEFTDLLEHFFYGMINGTAIELGAVDGTHRSSSQTLLFEDLGWRRILIEGNPHMRKRLLKQTTSFIFECTSICKE